MNPSDQRAEEVEKKEVPETGYLTEDEIKHLLFRLDGDNKEDSRSCLVQVLVGGEAARLQGGTHHTESCDVR